MSEPKKISHIIGNARTIQPAVLVCEYLRKRVITKAFPKEAIVYRFRQPTAENGYWSAYIVVEDAGDLPPEVISELCETCRAFVAGRGEVWA
jgi:hypothetical protein